MVELLVMKNLVLVELLLLHFIYQNKRFYSDYLLEKLPDVKKNLNFMLDLKEIIFNLKKNFQFFSIYISIIFSYIQQTMSFFNFFNL